MAKRFIDTDLFKKRFIRGLKGPYKLLWIYLFCDCDYAGIWEVDLAAAELFCGHKYTLSDLEEAFSGKVHFFAGGSKAFIPEFIEFQYPKGLQENNSAHKGVISQLSKYQLFEVLEKGATKGLPSTLQGAKDMVMDKDKDKKGDARGKIKAFQKPTLEAVAAYCKERGNSVDPQQWIDHYTANGWKVGKNPMRDWKAAVRTWEKNGYNDNGRNGQKTGATGRPTTIPENPAKKDYGSGTL